MCLTQGHGQPHRRFCLACPHGKLPWKAGKYSKEEVCAGRWGGEAAALFSVPDTVRGLGRAPQLPAGRAGRCGQRLCPNTARGPGRSGRAGTGMEPALPHPRQGETAPTALLPPSPLHPERTAGSVLGMGEHTGCSEGKHCRSTKCCICMYNGHVCCSLPYSPSPSPPCSSCHKLGSRQRCAAAHLP